MSAPQVPFDRPVVESRKSLVKAFRAFHSWFLTDTGTPFIVAGRRIAAFPSLLVFPSLWINGSARPKQIEEERHFLRRRLGRLRRGSCCREFELIVRLDDRKFVFNLAGFGCEFSQLLPKADSSTGRLVFHVHKIYEPQFPPMGNSTHPAASRRPTLTGIITSIRFFLSTLWRL
jgi:hypothetical protein